MRGVVFNIYRSELGKITLDNVFRERESLNICIVEAINKASEAWGIACLRYEISKLHGFIFFLLRKCYVTGTVLSNKYF